MAIIVLGIIVLLVGIFGAKQNTPVAKYKGLVMLAGIVITVIGIITSAIRIVPAGHVGVQVLFEEVQDRYLNAGMNFVNPLVRVEEMSVRTQNYTMASSPEEGQKRRADASRVMSKDGLAVTIDITILYEVKKEYAPRIYSNIGLDYEDKIIRPIIDTRIPEAAKNYKAVDLYAEKREEFKNEVNKALFKDFDSLGIKLKDVLVRNIDLPDDVKKSIEEKIKAVQEEQRMEFVVQREKREAERKVIEANGQAKFQRILDSALTNKVLQYEMIQVQKELVNSPNSKIIMLDGNGKNNPPFIIGK